MNESNQISVAAIQLSCDRDSENNIDRTFEAIEKAAAAGAKLICLQELFSSLYFCQSEDHQQFQLAESIPGPLTQRISELAQQLQVVIVAGLFERRAPGLFHNLSLIHI